MAVHVHGDLNRRVTKLCLILRVGAGGDEQWPIREWGPVPAEGPHSPAASISPAWARASSCCWRPSRGRRLCLELVRGDGRAPGGRGREGTGRGVLPGARDD